MKSLMLCALCEGVCIRQRRFQTVCRSGGGDGI